jgi:hypothetical protein
MPEQTFKSPGFFEKEVDLTQRSAQISGTPAGVIGTAQKGPAFVPVTVGSIADFNAKFGELDADSYGPYAVNEFLKHRTALTYVRVLGAGANSTSGHISTTETQGTVENAGFRIKRVLASTTSPNPGDGYHAGGVQFLVGKHTIHEAGMEGEAYPIFSDNDSFTTTSSEVNVVRGMLFLASGTKMEILDHDQSYLNIQSLGGASTGVKIKSYDGSKEQGTFKLVLSSSDGLSFNTQENIAGIKIFTASLDVNSDHYIGKILNKDPDNFQSERHLLYGEFPIEPGIARVKYHAANDTVALLSGSTTTHADNFGRFDTRYSNARTTSFISQPYGDKEYDLFHFETIDDGHGANRQVKVSIADLKRSTDPLNKYGTFTVQIRDYSDDDISSRILEQFANCTLNPQDENYIAKKIGDYKVYYNFDALSDDERRLMISGKFPNRSQYVRIVMNTDFNTFGNIPESALPFGFRGLPSLITNDQLTDTGTSHRLTGSVAIGDAGLLAAIVPPVPFTIKATRGKTKQGGSFFGDAGSSEVADPRIYWGVKNTMLPLSSSVSQAALMTNGGGRFNEIINSYTKLLGIQKLNILTKNENADTFNNNKFTLARVAFYNEGTVSDSSISGSADDHILNAVYVRNGKPDANTYNLSDGVLTDRITFGSLASFNTGVNPSKYFNRFTNYLKFTNVFHGGFDGLNILDKDARKMNDRASSGDAGGKAVADASSHVNLNSVSAPGVGLHNNIVASYRAATSIITDELSSRINILAIPGIRDSFVTDHAADRTKAYGKAIYLMDLENYDDDENRLYDDATTAPSVRITSEKFDGRGVDNNFAATYFPNVTLTDSTNGRLVKVPASIAALGAIAYNDSVSYPWFAPAGFNRGALDFVNNTATRLTTGDRDTLYEARINPISNFPQGGFVIFGQKTLQFSKSSLDRVNVRRMLLEVKRLVSDVANKIVFEQNNAATRNRFIKQVTPLISVIQTQQGINSFRVVMDASNNTAEDAEQNRLNGRIVLVPTRAIEFIAIDFIVTNSGVSFV